MLQRECSPLLDVRTLALRLAQYGSFLCANEGRLLHRKRPVSPNAVIVFTGPQLHFAKPKLCVLVKLCSRGYFSRYVWTDRLRSGVQHTTAHLQLSERCAGNDRSQATAYRGPHHLKIKPSLLTRLGIRDLMETARGSVHPSVMVCGTVAFQDRRVPVQVAPQGRDPPTPRVEASLVASAGSRPSKWN